MISQKPGFLQLAADRTHSRDHHLCFFFQLWIRLEDIPETRFLATGSRSRPPSEPETGLIFVMIRESAVEIDEGL
ncbi:MAG: hypothetical protein AB4352_09620 [Hormoscilla sp.]